VIDSSLYV